MNYKWLKNLKHHYQIHKKLKSHKVIIIMDVGQKQIGLKIQMLGVVVWIKILMEKDVLKKYMMQIDPIFHHLIIIDYFLIF